MRGIPCRRALWPRGFGLEDLHWADDATLLLVRHLAEGIDGLPLLLLATYRDAEVESSRGLARTLEALLRERFAERLPLRRLSMHSVESMLASMSGQAPPGRLARGIHQHTEGNPFFVEELFQHLAEEGKLFTLTGEWQADLRASDIVVPEGVRLVIRRRLERLSSSTVRVMTMAAVIGLTFDLQLLDALCRDAPDSMAEAIEEAERAHLVVPEEAGREPRYRFGHALIRQAMVEAVSLPRRQRLHVRIAAEIERLHGGRIEKHAPALAHHLVQAGAAADLEKARGFVVMAAEQAREAAAYEDALVHLDAALALADEGPAPIVADLHQRRADVLRSLGRFDMAAAEYDRAIELFDSLHDGVRLASATFPLALIHAWNADASRHLAATSRALDRLAESALADRCRVLFLHALGLTSSGDAVGGLAALDEAQTLKDALADPSLEVIGTLLEAHVRYQTMQIPAAMEASRQAMALCRANRDLWGYVDMEFTQVTGAVYMGRPRDARLLIAEGLHRAERVGHHNVVFFYRLVSAALEMAAGHLDDAERVASEARAFGDTYRIPWNFSSELILGQLALYRGDAEWAARHLERAIDLEPAGYWSGVSRAALFAALAQDGRQEAFDVVRDRPLRLPVISRPNPFGSWVSLTYWIEGLAAADRCDQAGALQPSAEALLASGASCFRDMRPYRIAAGIAAACAGAWSLAEEHFGTVVQHARQAGMPVAEGWARFWQGKLLGAHYDDARGVTLLREAERIFESLAMPGCARRAARERRRGRR